ncbi:hypothetical protein IKG64_03205 [Candidatus Saccharibacteria bacterium]|nr:hypothetical protein [Candidatus Saccharibacteria bacterium]
MKSIRRGFTLIEVALFLAITGALFVGIALGVQNSMFQQRYNDSVQSFAEFLRSTYSQVSNVQNSNASNGRSGQAIYGRLIVFGEERTLDDERNSDNAIYSYAVIGDADTTFPSGNALDALRALGLTVFDSAGQLAGNYEEYKPRWTASIQTTDSDTTKFVGAILIARHPRSGTIFTFAYQADALPDDLEINQMTTSETKANLSLDGFENSEVNFCINPNGDQPSDARRNVRIIANARNASGVEVIDLDAPREDGGNQCNGS